MEEVTSNGIIIIMILKKLSQSTRLKQEMTTAGIVRM